MSPGLHLAGAPDPLVAGQRTAVRVRLGVVGGAVRRILGKGGEGDDQADRAPERRPPGLRARRARAAGAGRGPGLCGGGEHVFATVGSHSDGPAILQAILHPFGAELLVGRDPGPGRRGGARRPKRAPGERRTNGPRDEVVGDHPGELKEAWDASGAEHRAVAGIEPRVSSRASGTAASSSAAYAAGALRVNDGVRRSDPARWSAPGIGPGAGRWVRPGMRRMGPLRGEADGGRPGVMP